MISGVAFSASASRQVPGRTLLLGRTNAPAAAGATLRLAAATLLAAEVVVGMPSYSTAETAGTVEQSPANAPKQVESNASAEKKAVRRFDIDEYRVDGADAMPQVEIEEAIYPFLGPQRTAEDIEKARAALEKAYIAKGYQTVSVAVSDDGRKDGVVVLKVTEIKVGRLRVTNSRYFDIDKIKDKAPSVAEGKLPNINEVTKDVVSLNQWPDRKIKPVLRAGVAPGTVDVDLNVEDKFPFHGSVEINNRQSPNTKSLRAITTLRYDNLWQRGDSATFSYQVAPERPEDVTVFSGSYLARTNYDWLNILVSAVKSDSSVATVGGSNIVGPGETYGARGIFTLPPRENFFHTVSIGADYKKYGQKVSFTDNGANDFSTPILYVDNVINYSAAWQREGASTLLNVGVTYGLRGAGTDAYTYDAKRLGGAANFIYLRGDVSHTQDFLGNFQVFGKLQGQVSDQPLPSSEQFALGGLDTVRGYLEVEALGDRAWATTVEFRTPNISDWLKTSTADKGQKPIGIDEWRWFLFGDAGRAEAYHQSGSQSVFMLASYGLGTRVRLLDYMNGMVVVAMPVASQSFTLANHPSVIFRAWGEF